MTRSYTPSGRARRDIRTTSSGGPAAPGRRAFPSPLAKKSSATSAGPWCGSWRRRAARAPQSTGKFIFWSSAA